MKNKTILIAGGAGYIGSHMVRALLEGNYSRFEIGPPRRPGDPARLVASSKKAERVLGWKPKANLEQIISTAWSCKRAKIKATS